MPASDDILTFCKNCRETTLEGIRAKAKAAGVHIDEDIERLILHPRLMKVYVPLPFDLEHYERHLKGPRHDRRARIRARVPSCSYRRKCQ
jgi:hypothetical protein